MRFWDSSAVIPLLIEQEASSLVVGWVAGDDAMVLWTLTPVEVVSAFRRLVREKALEEDIAHRAEARMGEIVQVSQMVIDVEPSRRSRPACCGSIRFGRSTPFNSVRPCTGQRAIRKAGLFTLSTAGWRSLRNARGSRFLLEVRAGCWRRSDFADTAAHQ